MKFKLIFNCTKVTQPCKAVTEDFSSDITLSIVISVSLVSMAKNTWKSSYAQGQQSILLKQSWLLHSKWGAASKEKTETLWYD